MMKHRLTPDVFITQDEDTPPIPPEPTYTLLDSVKDLFTVDIDGGNIIPTDDIQLDEYESSKGFKVDINVNRVEDSGKARLYFSFYDFITSEFFESYIMYNSDDSISDSFTIDSNTLNLEIMFDSEYDLPSGEYSDFNVDIKLYSID